MFLYSESQYEMQLSQLMKNKELTFWEAVAADGFCDNKTSSQGGLRITWSKDAIVAWKTSCCQISFEQHKLNSLHLHGTGMVSEISQQNNKKPPWTRQIKPICMVMYQWG